MKFKSNFVLGIFVGMLLVGAFSVGKAYASTGCFTDTVGHPFETYICWMKDNGITGGSGGEIIALMAMLLAGKWQYLCKDRPRYRPAPVIFTSLNR